jgi:hypothetical protein
METYGGVSKESIQLLQSLSEHVHSLSHPQNSCAIPFALSASVYNVAKLLSGLGHSPQTPTPTSPRNSLFRWPAIRSQTSHCAGLQLCSSSPSPSCSARCRRCFLLLPLLSLSSCSLLSFTLRCALLIYVLPALDLLLLLPSLFLTLSLSLPLNSPVLKLLVPVCSVGIGKEKEMEMEMERDK